MTLPWHVRGFVLLVVGSASAAATVVLGGSDLSTVGLLGPSAAALATLVLLAELRPIEVARGDITDEITLSTGAALALVFVGSLWFAMLVMSLSVVVQDARLRKAPVKCAYNSAQYALSLIAAALAFGALTGASVLQPLPVLALPSHLPAALVACCTFFAVNTLLTGAVTALALGQPLVPWLLSDLRFQIATNGLLLLYTPVLTAGLQISVWLLPLLVLPMGAIYVSADLARSRQGEALHDGLTGLSNRTLFGLRVERVCEASGPVDRPRAAVMLLDLDHFKEINDTLGHHVGDQLLTAVAERLTRSLRPGDTVARLGGDEFAVLAVDLDGPEDALEVGQRVLEALTLPFTIDGVRLDVEGSLGISLHPQHGHHKDLLLRTADIALYAAKVERSCVRMYDPAQDSHTLERLALATDLREGLERGQLFLHYQPQIDTKSGSVVGFEALVRWSHPRLGVLMPDAFLPIVENTGLIGPLTMEVLDMALTAVALWRAAGHDVSVAVNLSVRHLTDLSLPAQIEECLVKRALPPGALVLEVTETLIMTDPGRAMGVLALLQDLGIGLAIDDFGTGYSSLAYLRRLHVDELKIDKSFVLQLATSEDDAVIVRSTIELGHNLGLRLVAEGVEDQATLDLLSGWGCDVAQGYFISRPMPGPDVLPWLAQALTSPDRWAADGTTACSATVGAS